MNAFLAGVLTGLSLAVGLYFWRSWRDTRERLFAYFGSSFLVLAAHWASLALISPGETNYRVYLSRLLAFLLIILGIVDKNRRRPDPGR